MHLETLSQFAKLRFTPEEQDRLQTRLPACKALLKEVEAFASQPEPAVEESQQSALRTDRSEPSPLAEAIGSAAPKRHGPYISLALNTKGGN